MQDMTRETQEGLWQVHLGHRGRTFNIRHLLLLLTFNSLTPTQHRHLHTPDWACRIMQSPARRTRTRIRLYGPPLGLIPRLWGIRQASTILVAEQRQRQQPQGHHACMSTRSTHLRISAIRTLQV